MRTRFMMSILLVVSFLMVGGLSSAAAETTWTCPEGFEGQTLRIFGWSDNVAETTIPDFEDACGVTVEYSVVSTNDQLRTILEVGDAQYDLIIATSAGYPQLIQEGLIQPLDHSLIPNLEKDELFLSNMPVDPDNDYSVPYQWGTIGIAYDSTIVDTPMTSWDDFFAYDGRVAWIDDSRLFLKLALRKLGLPFTSTDEADIQAAADYLLEVPKNDVFAITDSAQTDLLLNGEVDAIVVISRQAVRIKQDCDCDDFVFVLPSDGLVPWLDSMAIPAGAENPALAHAFIDYILDPQVNADLSSALGSASPYKNAWSLVNEDVMNNGISYMSAEVVEAFVNDTLIVDQVGQGTELYVDAWTRVKAELAGR